MFGCRVSGVLRAQSERAAGDAYNLGFVHAKDLRAPPATAAFCGREDGKVRCGAK